MLAVPNWLTASAVAVLTAAVGGVVLEEVLAQPLPSCASNTSTAVEKRVEVMYKSQKGYLYKTTDNLGKAANE
ncbi:hypothetical protein CDA63_16485 [Hymenobacter amundsenii]|uniref:Uncharacterized protein n=1 Tax=Hymenobacter amundsenii TaxID=2006685 RepID=A0A246FKA2_9BACT|nr:hypothetical protein CDA63_16485 [Hymenobacter amundsenii]